ncbi:MAG: mitofilin family membrane protein [Xanthobacteraceae bacterium]
MAKGNRPEDDTPPPSPKRRRRPHVLELKATEVGAERIKPVREKPKAEQPKDSGATAAKDWTDQLRAVEWRAWAAKPIVTGAIGVLGGAILVFAVMSLFGGRSGEDNARVSDLAGEVATLSARIESLTKRPAPALETSALGDRIDRLTKAISESEQRLAAIERRPAPQPTDLSGVNERTAGIEATLKDLRGSLADLRRMAEQAPPAATPTAVDALANRIGGLEERISALAAPRPAPATTSLAAEIVVLNALSDAIRSGKPFLKELEAARARLGERAAPLAALEPHAAKGLPTVPELAERFSVLAPELLRGPEPEGGIFSRLLTNATRLVEIRPIGEPEGASVGAVVARMETKLARGDLAGALAEVDLLRDSVKSIVSDWTAAAVRRRDAEQIVKQLTDAALTINAGRKPS